MTNSDEKQPSKVEHFIDTDFDPKTEEFSYYYNYLLYTFEHNGSKITARSYLDEISEVSILKCPADVDFASEAKGSLADLRRRYRTIKRLGANGYDTV